MFRKNDEVVESALSQDYNRQSEGKEEDNGRSTVMEFHEGPIPEH
jgi:hypothetical protein